MADLSTRTQRRRLPASRTIHWVRQDNRGAAIGYRRTSEAPGTWYARVRVAASEGRVYRVKALDIADDLGEDSGLSYREAALKASTWDPAEDERRAAEGPRAAVTVADAVARYLEWYRVHRRAYNSAKNTLEAHVLPGLGPVKLADLTAARLAQWHMDLAEAPAKLRGKRGDPERRVRVAETDDQKRSRRATANRVLGTLKAALSHAAPGDVAPVWRAVKAFRDADSARIGYLDREELRRLLNGCAVDFRTLVQAAVYTGARFSELAALNVGDYRPEASAVHIPKSKGGISRFVYLNAEGVAFFERVAAGRPPEERLLRRASGAPWVNNDQARPMAEACAAAGLKPLGFHQLRHTYASLYVMSGGSLVSLARQLGHTSTRMVEKFYGHLSDAWRAAEASRHAPAMGLESGRVVKMRRKRTK